MAEKLGEAIMELRTDDSQLRKGLAEGEKMAASTADRFNAFGKRAAMAGGKLSLAITAPLTVLGKQAFDAAIQSREALAQVESALTSMGGASGKTVEELQKAAKQLETFSNFDDDDILQKVTANLLTFGNVAGDVFDKAQQAAVDLSARLGQDLQSSTVMLGKALNDPVKGITALSRVGVSFTEDQKEMIKAMAEAGDIAGAQTLILAELEKQYGGAAKAARDAAPGGDQAQAWRTLQEVIGERLVQAFEKFEAVTTPVINAFLSLSPEVQTAVVVFAGLAAALGPALIVLGMIASGIGSIIAIAPALAAGFTAIKVAGLALMANPFVLAFAAVLAAIYLAWQNWHTITALLEGIGATFTGWWQGSVQPVLDGLMEKISEVIRIFTSIFGPEIKAVVGMIGALMRGDFSAAWELAKEAVRQSIEAKLRLIQSLVPGAISSMKALYDGVKLWLVDKFNGLVELFMGPIRKIEGGFAWLYDRVVGNSWVPDLVDRLGEEAARFGIEFVNPMLDGARQVDAAFAGITPPDINTTPGGMPPLPGLDPQSQGAMRDGFSQSFADGIRAAINGDLGGFLDQFFSRMFDNSLRGAMDAIFGGAGGGGGIGGFLSSIFAGFFATGGTIPRGQFGIVGERGPELAFAGQGGLGIMSNTDTRALISGNSGGGAGAGTTVNIPISIDATGADPAALERVRGELDSLKNELPAQILSVTQDGLERRVIGMGGAR